MSTLKTSGEFLVSRDQRHLYAFSHSGVVSSIRVDRLMILDFSSIKDARLPATLKFSFSLKGLASSSQFRSSNFPLHVFLTSITLQSMFKKIDRKERATFHSEEQPWREIWTTDAWERFPAVRNLFHDTRVFNSSSSVRNPLYQPLTLLPY